MNTNQIKAAKPGETLYDDKVRGLQLRAFAGKKAFYCYFRIKGSGVERRPKVGEYPAIDLAAARETASAWLRAASLGQDPTLEMKEAAQAPTMEALCARYMERHGNKKKTADEDLRMINSYILPKIGKKRVAAVRHVDVDDLHRELGSSAPTQANRVLALLSKMFNLAIKWEYVTANPCKGVARFKEKKRRRYARPDEAMAIAAALEKYKDQYPAQALFLWLLLFTGARPSEIAALKRSQRVAHNRFELTEHKTDQDGEPRIIHLPPQAVEILDAMPAPRDGTVTGIQSPRHLWKIIMDETGITNLRRYDLRHNHASASIAVGHSLAQVGLLLGHKDPSTTKRYAHLIDEVGSVLAEKTGDFLENMIKPKEKAQA